MVFLILNSMQTLVNEKSGPTRGTYHFSAVADYTPLGYNAVGDDA